MTKTVEPTAFHKWLMQVSGGQKGLLEFIIRDQALDQNPQVFELLEATGDKTYTPATFEKAADIVIELFKNK